MDFNNQDVYTGCDSPHFTNYIKYILKMSRIPF